MSARSFIQSSNPNALVTQENGREVFIEDFTDADWRMFRLEFSCDADGRNAKAKVLYNPWGSNPYDAGSSHLFSDGTICLGPHNKTFTIEEAVARARYWVNGYSYLREHGTFPNPS